MGSLMAGWNSPFLDPKAAKLERNKSLTKEGIEAYWKSKKKPEEENQGDNSELEMKITKENTLEEPDRPLPLANAKWDELEMETETSLEEFLKKTGWWTRTSSAFLNEPPVIATEGGPTYKYASQYHVAGINPTSNPYSNAGIPTLKI